ncbi:hypothetical protein U9M48_019566, partial [Paspalum notatum var. saurae]
VIESVKQTPAYRNKLKALEFERTGGISSKKKGHKQVDIKVEEELNNDVDLQIHGVEKPSVWRLCGVQFILLPYSIGKVLTWDICWFWRYWVKKLPFAWEDACYLTRTTLQIPANTWKNIEWNAELSRSFTSDRRSSSDQNLLVNTGSRCDTMEQ